MVTQTKAPDEDKAAGVAAPYVSWATFKNAVIDTLKGTIPNQIDRSVFKGLAGGVQTALLGALRFLGLIDTSGKTTEYLAAVCDIDEKKRKAAFAEVLRRSYPELFALPITTATVKQVHDQMEAYDCNGQTKDKAFRFFLLAAQYAEVPVSRLLFNGVGSVSSRKRVAPGSRKEAPSPATENSQPSSPSSPIAEDAEDAEPAPEPGYQWVKVPDDFIVYRCKIAKGVVIEIPLPNAITKAEVDRIHAFLVTQIDDEDEGFGGK
jgi:hypothetical protein